MAIVLDVLVAGVVAGGVAGGVVLASRPRLARRTGEPLPAGAGSGRGGSRGDSANGGAVSPRSSRDEEATAASRGEHTRAAGGDGAPARSSARPTAVAAA